MKKFDKLYNEIMETTYFSDSLGRKFYEINDEAFFPIQYSINNDNILIAASNLNEDSLHVLNRLKERTHDLYTFNDFITMVKLGINKFFNDKLYEVFTPYRRKNHLKITTNFDKTDYSCIIISEKRYEFMKVCINIVYNLGKNSFELYDNKIQALAANSQYFCFINTILEKSMINKSNDKELNIESKINNKNILKII